MNRHTPKINRVIGKKFDLHNKQAAHAMNKNIDKTSTERKKKELMAVKIAGEYGLIQVVPHESKEPTIRKIEGEYGLLYVEDNSKQSIKPDHDLIICIPSYNRYKKVTRLLDQFYCQPTKYSFKIILLNDGSTDKRYNDIPYFYTGVTYLKNETPNGKILHWYNYNQLWSVMEKFNTNCVLQMDDDFILCDDFLDIIMDLYHREKVKNSKFCGITPHLWSFIKKAEYESWWESKIFVDGIALLDLKLIKFLKYGLQPINVEEVSKTGVPVRAWSQITEAVSRFGGYFYRTKHSLVFHDGNNDSKLHSDVKNRGVYTQKFIKDFKKQNITL